MGNDMADNDEPSEQKGKTGQAEPSERLDQLKHPGTVGQRRPRRLLVAVTVFAAMLATGASVVAVLALSEAREARSELSDSQGEVGSLSQRLGDMQGAIDSVQSDVQSVQSDVSSVESNVASLVDPSGELNELSGRIDDVAFDVRLMDDAVFGFFGLSGSIDDLKSCLNTYMETVGNSGGGRYTYYMC